MREIFKIFNLLENDVQSIAAVSVRFSPENNSQEQQPVTSLCSRLLFLVKPVSNGNDLAVYSLAKALLWQRQHDRDYTIY